MTPKPVTDLYMVFPASAVTDGYLPPMDEIPKKYRRDQSAWNVFVRDWMHGRFHDVSMLPAEDATWTAEEAYRHIQVVLRSFEPKHEHKMAAAAYLADLWFLSVRWKPEQDGHFEMIGDCRMWDEFDLLDSNVCPEGCVVTGPHWHEDDEIKLSQFFGEDDGDAQPEGD